MRDQYYVEFSAGLHSAIHNVQGIIGIIFYVTHTGRSSLARCSYF